MTSKIRGIDNFDSQDPLLTNTRQGAMNQEPVSQSESVKAGMSSTIYTGGQPVDSEVVTGLNMNTGDFGGLVWVKSRTSSGFGHLFTDSVRGNDKGLQSQSTDAESTDANRVKTFTDVGFTIGTASLVNAGGGNYVAWSWHTNKKTSGLTNRGKAFTAHYNTDLGFSIVGYAGDATAGHEIPHQLGVEPELSIFKNRSVTKNWRVHSPLLDAGGYLTLDNKDAEIVGAGETTFDSESVAPFQSSTTNTTGENFISYHFTSVKGVSKIGKYTGTGAVGNYVDCGFKAGWVLIKNLTQAGDWCLLDLARSDSLGKFLFPNESFAEQDGSALIDTSDNGFVLGVTATNTNVAGDEYLFMAFAESSSDSLKTITNYNEPTTPDTLTIVADTLISYGVGNEIVGAGETFSLGAGYESKKLWLYKDQDGTYGVTENRPLEGITRNDADKYGLVSPLNAALRTTDTHRGYASASGVVSASAETNGAAWLAFEKSSNTVSNKWATNTAGPAQLQYKQTEARVLKSCRMRMGDIATQHPRRFTIEGSNDGLNWNVIFDQSGADYTGSNGVSLWDDLIDISANATAYEYHQINIITNVSGSFLAIAEMEFNTVLPSDYYLVDSQKMFNDAGTEIDRSYLTEIMTDAQGDVSWFRNLPVAKVKANDVEIHGGLTYQGSPMLSSETEGDVTILKLADGTMIETASFTQAVTSGANVTKNFKGAFVDTPSCNWWWYGSGFTSLPVNFQAAENYTRAIINFGGTKTAVFGYTAIGRWKK